MVITSGAKLRKLHGSMVKSPNQSLTHAELLHLRTTAEILVQGKPEAVEPWCGKPIWNQSETNVQLAVQLS